MTVAALTLNYNMMDGKRDGETGESSGLNQLHLCPSRRLSAPLPLQISLIEIHPEMATALPLSLSLPLPVCGSMLLCVQSVDQRSQSAEPVIIEAAEGAESRPSDPDARSTSPR